MTFYRLFFYWIDDLWRLFSITVILQDKVTRNHCWRTILHICNLQDPIIVKFKPFISVSKDWWLIEFMTFGDFSIFCTFKWLNYSFLNYLRELLVYPNCEFWAPFPFGIFFWGGEPIKKREKKISLSFSRRLLNQLLTTPLQCKRCLRNEISMPPDQGVYTCIEKTNGEPSWADFSLMAEPLFWGACSMVYIFLQKPSSWPLRQPPHLNKQSVQEKNSIGREI